MPKQVVFCEDHKAVVGGSDHGHVYVFDRRSGQTLDKLPHDDKGMVQTIAVGKVLQIPAESNTRIGQRHARRDSDRRSHLCRPRKNLDIDVDTKEIINCDGRIQQTLDDQGSGVGCHADGDGDGNGHFGLPECKRFGESVKRTECRTCLLTPRRISFKI